MESGINASSYLLNEKELVLAFVCTENGVTSHLKALFTEAAGLFLIPELPAYADPYVAV
jgi:hypothetical protein